MILNGKVINPGELRTSVVLKSRTVVNDAGGFPKEGPGSTIATVWARWSNVHGSEVWAAESAQASAPATVLIRYRSDINPTCYVVKGSDVFEIVSLDDIGERHEYIELKVKRLVNG